MVPHFSLKKMILPTLLLLTLILSACGGASSSSGSANSGKKLTIGLSISSIDNAFFVAMDNGVKQEASKLGYSVLDNNANNDAATQINQVENLLTRKVDVIIINPVSSEGIAPVVKQANSMNIPVITLDRSSSGGTVASFIQSDNVRMGQQSADFIVQQLKARYGSPKGNVVDIQGQRGTSSAEDREKGFVQEIQKYPGIKIVASQSANFNQEQAYNVTSNILQANSQVDAIFGANDDSSVGALKAVQAANRFAPLGSAKHIIIIGIDGTPQALQAIRDGQLDATVTQNPERMAVQAVDIAKAFAASQKYDSHVLYPAMLISKSNIDSTAVKQFGLWGEQSK
jgi:ABC-type sugar transport system, periplasmic component